MQTLPVMLARIEYASPVLGQRPFDLLMAGSVVSFIPMLILFVVFQRRLQEGLTAGQ